MNEDDALPQNGNPIGYWIVLILYTYDLLTFCDFADLLSSAVKPYNPTLL